MNAVGGFGVADVSVQPEFAGRAIERLRGAVVPEAVRRSVFQNERPIGQEAVELSRNAVVEDGAARLAAVYTREGYAVRRDREAGAPVHVIDPGACRIRAGLLVGAAVIKPDDVAILECRDGEVADLVEAARSGVGTEQRAPGSATGHPLPIDRSERHRAGRTRREKDRCSKYRKKADAPHLGPLEGV